jgi:hypothetical protein
VLAALGANGLARGEPASVHLAVCTPHFARSLPAQLSPLQQIWHFVCTLFFYALLNRSL